MCSYDFGQKYTSLVITAQHCILWVEQVVVVGLGDRQNAMMFSKLLDFPLRLLYAGKRRIVCACQVKVEQ